MLLFKAVENGVSCLQKPPHLFYHTSILQG